MLSIIISERNLDLRYLFLTLLTKASLNRLFIGNRKFGACLSYDIVRFLRCPCSMVDLFGPLNLSCSDVIFSFLDYIRHTLGEFEIP